MKRWWEIKYGLGNEGKVEGDREMEGNKMKVEGKVRMEDKGVARDRVEVGVKR